MPRPPQNVRIARLAAVLALDDAVRASRELPDVETVGKRLGLGKPSATDIRRHIALRHGVPVPLARVSRLRDGAPPPPATLTWSEFKCYRVMATATTPLSAGEIYAQAFVCLRDSSSGDCGRKHINAMRRKGVDIARQHGVGYWLAAKRIEGEPPYLEPMARLEAMEVAR